MVDFCLLCTLADIYCPNVNQTSFFIQVLSKLKDFATGITILTGDINLPLDPLLDTSQGRTGILCKWVAQVRKSLHSAQTIDTWRVVNPKERDFSYYSKIHESYTRIDTIFIDHYHLPQLLSASMGTMSLSDHAPVSARLAISAASL